MPQAVTFSEAFSFTPSALLELWRLDVTNIGVTTVFYFVNASSSNYQPIVFNGVSYLPFPIKVESVDVDGKSSLTRPKLTVSNINGFVSSLLLSNDNSLDGAIVTRTRVHARFLDAVNFPAGQPLPLWVTPNPTAKYPDEPFEINRLITQNNEIVQWELKSPIEMQGARLPRRQIIGNVCTFKYRQPGTCNYSGPPISDKANRTFTGHYGMTLVDRGLYDASTTYNRGDYVYVTPNLPQFANIPAYWVCATNGTQGIQPTTLSGNWIGDMCSKSVAGCKLRFPTVPLRTSAFPGVSRAGWLARQ